MTTTHDHAAVIRAATEALYRKLDAEGRPRVIGKHLEAINNAAAALQGQRDYHRDDAAAVRRERDTKINRLAGELAEETRAGDALNAALAQSEVDRLMLADRLAEAKAENARRGGADRGGRTTTMTTTRGGHGREQSKTAPWQGSRRRLIA